MGALNAAALSVLPLPEPTPPPQRRDIHAESARFDGVDYDAVKGAVRYHVIKRSMPGRGDRCIVICDCWDLEELEMIGNLPPHLPWFNNVTGAIIDIERWSPANDSWELCNDPRRQEG